MLKLVICDDEMYYADLLYGNIREYMDERNIECDITMACRPEDILESDARFDIAVLDIEMGDVSGTDVAEELKRRNSRVLIFFITNYDEYQDEAMDIQAMRFFTKPFDKERLYNGLDKAIDKINHSHIEIFINTAKEHKRLKVEDIAYITNKGRRAVISAESGMAEVNESFESLCGRIVSEDFFKIHKSFFVNLHHITRYSYSEVSLKDGTKISIAPRRRAEFKKYWWEYVRRNE